MSINTYIIVGVWLGLFVVLPLLLLAFMKNGKAKSAILSVLMILYLGVIVVGVISDLTITKSTTTINFDFSGKVGGKPVNWNFENLTSFDIIVNLVMLFPLGMFIAYFIRHIRPMNSLLICWYIGFVVGFILELLQFVLPISRSVQLSDAVFNMISLFIGGFFGSLLTSLATKIYKKEK